MAEILTLATQAFGGPGGIAAYNRSIISAFSKLGYRARVLVRSHTCPELPPRVSQKTVRGGAAQYAAAALAAALRTPAPEIIWCGHVNMLPLGVLLSSITRRPLWLQIHGIEAWRARSRFSRQLLRKTDLVTSVSRYSRREFLKWAPIPPHRVRVIHNIVDPKYESPPATAKIVSDLRIRYNLQNAKSILTISRLDARESYKGHDKIIESLKAVSKNITNVVYLVGGEGTDLERLREKARKTGVMHLCRFIGQVPEAELIAHYRLADVFAMPSTGEGFGIVFIEAMACGTPALGLNVDGSVDALTSSPIGTISSAENLSRDLTQILSSSPTGRTERPSYISPAFRFDSFVNRVKLAMKDLEPLVGNGPGGAPLE